MSVVTFTVAVWMVIYKTRNRIRCALLLLLLLLLLLRRRRKGNTAAVYAPLI